MKIIVVIIMTRNCKIQTKYSNSIDLTEREDTGGQFFRG